MVRKIFSIFFYVLGGFFVYGVCLLAFTNIPEVGMFKFVIMAIFSIPALIFLVVGAATCRFKNWKPHIGIALLSGIGFNLFVVITFFCLQSSSEFKEIFPDNKLVFFNDYFSGFFVMLVVAGLAAFMLLKNK